MITDDLSALHAQLVAVETQARLASEHVERLSRLQSGMETLSEAALTTQAAVSSSLAAVGTQVSNAQTSLYGLKGISIEAADHVGQAMGRVDSAVNGASGSLLKMSTLVAETQAVATQAGTLLGGLRDDADLTHLHLATRLDDLEEVVSDHTNLWNKAVAELIDAVKHGVEPVEKLLHLYGEAKIGSERLRDYLGGLNLHIYQNQISDLIAALQHGKVEIGDVLKFLNESQLPFVKQLASTIELFRQGKVTLERVREIVEQLRKVFPDSQFVDLAQTLEFALQEGR
jgi:hypothetical protein